ncbi:glucose-1-phosphate thymidylyltransferase [Streptomyces albogriseolus]
MKALVLSGGAGTRLRPFTHTSPKQLVPVANKPVLYYVLEAIAEAGITEVGVVVGDTADEICAAVGDGSRFGLDVTYLPQHAPLGLSHAVLIARDFLGDDDFVMYLGDNFLVGGITPLVEQFTAERPDAQILLTRVSDPTAFGVAELDGHGRVVGLEEKPAKPKSDLALVGVYLFSPAVHEAVRAIRPSARGELEITDAIQWLIDTRHDVRSATVSGYWKDTGNVADMLEANRSVLDGIGAGVEGTVDAGSELVGRVRVEAGAEVRGSRIVGPRRDRRRQRDQRLLRRPLHLHRGELPYRGQRDRVLHRAAGLPAGRRAPRAGLAHRPQRHGDPRAAHPEGPPADPRRPQQGADLLLTPGGSR